LTRIEGDDGDTVIVATTPEEEVTSNGSMAAVTPFAEAVICVVPAATPVAIPLLFIVATLVALLVHVKVTPVTVLPLLSFAVAVNC